MTICNMKDCRHHDGRFACQLEYARITSNGKCFDVQAQRESSGPIYVAPLCFICGRPMEQRPVFLPDGERVEGKTYVCETCGRFRVI